MSLAALAGFLDLAPAAPEAAPDRSSLAHFGAIVRVYKARVFLALAKRILVAKGPDPFDQLGVWVVSSGGRDKVG